MKIENESALWRRAKRGDRRAVDDLVRGYTPLVSSVLRSMPAYGGDGAASAALEGLRRGVMLYNPRDASNACPVTFIRPWIVRSVIHHARKMGSSRAVPGWDRRQAYKRAHNELLAETGKTPAVDACERRAGLTPGRYAKDARAFAIAAPASLDVMLADEHKPFATGHDVIADMTVDVEAQALGRVEQEDIWRLVDALPDRARRAIQYTYIDGLSQKRIAALLDISQFEVHRTLKRGRAALAQQLAA